MSTECILLLYVLYNVYIEIKNPLIANAHEHLNQVVFEYRYTGDFIRDSHAHSFRLYFVTQGGEGEARFYLCNLYFSLFFIIHACTFFF